LDFDRVIEKIKLKKVFRKTIQLENKFNFQFVKNQAFLILTWAFLIDT
jgi:hypothetical protein